MPSALDAMTKDPDFLKLSPRDQRVAVAGLLDTDPDFKGLNPADQAHVRNTVQSQFPDVTGAATTAPAATSTPAAGNAASLTPSPGGFAFLLQTAQNPNLSASPGLPPVAPVRPVQASARIAPAVTPSATAQTPKPAPVQVNPKIPPQQAQAFARSQYLAPRDAGFENAVQSYTQNFLQEGHVPNGWLQKALSMPLDAAENYVRSTVQNEPGRVAILRAVREQNGSGLTGTAALPTTAAAVQAPLAVGTTPAGKTGVVMATGGKSLAKFKADNQAEVNDLLAKQDSLTAGVVTTVPAFAGQINIPQQVPGSIYSSDPKEKAQAQKQLAQVQARLTQLGVKPNTKPFGVVNNNPIEGLNQLGASIVQGKPYNQAGPSTVGAIVNRIAGQPGTYEAAQSGNTLAEGTSQANKFANRLATGLTSFGEPESLATMMAAAPLALLGKGAQLAGLAAFGAPVAKQAYEDVKAGEYGAAAGDVAAFLAPFAAHKGLNVLDKASTPTVSNPLPSDSPFANVKSGDVVTLPNGLKLNIVDASHPDRLTVQREDGQHGKQTYLRTGLQQAFEAQAPKPAPEKVKAVDAVKVHTESTVPPSTATAETTANVKTADVPPVAEPPTNPTAGAKAEASSTAEKSSGAVAPAIVEEAKVSPDTVPKEPPSEATTPPETEAKAESGQNTGGEEKPAQEAPKAGETPKTQRAANADVQAHLDRMNLDGLTPADKQSVAESLQKAMEDGKNGEAHNLAQTILEKPRPLTTEEQAGFRIRLNEIEDQTAKKLTEISKAVDAGDTAKAAELKSQQEKLNQEYSTIAQANKRGGTETARSLAFRAEDTTPYKYTYQQIRERAQAANPESPVTPQEDSRIQALTSKLAETEAALKAHEEKAANGDAQKAVNQIRAEEVQAQREARKSGRQAKSKDLKAEAEDLRRRFVKAMGINLNFDPTVLPILKEIVRNGVQQKLLTVDALIDHVKNVLGTDLPEGITNRDIRDAISGYGQEKATRTTSPEQSKINDLNKQMKLLSQIEDAKAGVKPEKGTPPPKPSAEVQDLQKQLADLQKSPLLTPKEKAEISVAQRQEMQRKALEKQIADIDDRLNGKPAKVQTPTPSTPELDALRSQRDALREKLQAQTSKSPPSDEARLQAAMDRTQNRIDALESALKTGTKITAPASKPLPSSPEFEALKARRDALQTQYDEANKQAQAQPDPLKGIKTRLQKQIDALNERIKTGNFDKAERPKPIYDAEAEKLRAERDALKMQAEKIIRDRTPLKTSEKILNAGRNMKLTSLTVFEKLAGASLWHFPVEALADVFGVGAGKLRVNGRALAEVGAREGQFVPSAKIKGVRAALSREAFNNAKQTILHGFNEIDARAGAEVHGGGMLSPGRLHGAEKSPLQTGAYAEAVDLRMRRAAQQGLDVTDPEVQAKIGLGAALDAQSAKLSGPNAGAKAINNVFASVQRSPSMGVRVLGNFFHSLAPIVKLPLNYAGKAFDMTGAGLVRGEFMRRKAANAERAGTPMDAETADKIMRAYKYGGVGLVTAYIGLAQPDWFKSAGFFSHGNGNNKDREGKPMEADTLQIGGHTVPRIAAHSPLNMAIQVWASVRHGLEQTKANRDTSGRLGQAAKEAIGGFVSEAPGVEDISKISSAAVGDKNAGKTIGQYAKGMTIPSAVQQAAKYFDKDKQGNPIQREEKGLVDTYKTGWPVARQTVKRKGPKSSGGGRSSSTSGGFKFPNFTPKF